MVKEKMDNAFVLVKLKEKGTNVMVITGKSLGLKGEGYLPEYEDMCGVSVHRVFRNIWWAFAFPGLGFKKKLELAEQFHPDLIFCSLELNIRFATMLQKRLNKPIILLVEDAGKIFSGEAYQDFKSNILFRLLRVPRGKLFWPWLCKKADAIVTCHPRDNQNLEQLSGCGKPVSFVPWPTYIPDDFEPPISRKLDRGVYIGSLFPFKNTQEFEYTLPRIVSETPTKEFIVVGPGPHAEIIKKLEKETSGAVKYIPELPRTEALRLIASSYYAYTPVAKGGWGFIGDCWSVKTPIVMTHNDDYVTNGVNALVSENADSLIENINRLYNDDILYRKIQARETEESRIRSTELVSVSLYELFKKNIEERK
jgi:hypothetical protein